MNEYRIFETLFDMIPFGIYVANMETYEIVYINSIFKEKFGEQQKNKKCYELIFGNDAPCIFCNIPKLKKIIRSNTNESLVSEQFNEQDDRYYRMEERAIFWPNGALVKYTISIDISEQKEIQNSLAEAHARLVLQSNELEAKNVELQSMYEKTRNIAEKDYLTGLYNRRFFYEIGQSMVDLIVRQNMSSYMVIIDIDYFKKINDKYGHTVGDDALRSLASILKHSFRKSDLVGRVGGEEFAFILTDLSEEKAIDLLETFRKNVEKNALIVDENTSVSCTVSIGAAAIKSDNFDECISKADQLMYQAKEQGRNRVIVQA